MSSPHVTVFTGVLVQESALTVGGVAGGTFVDAPLARDGRGRPTLRGTSLAGSLIQTLERLGHRVPREVCGRRDAAGDHPEDSAWTVESSHVASDCRTEIRPGVGILQATGAAAEHVLHDAEVLPAGTQWPFTMSVDRRRAGQVEQQAAAALMEWTRGRCWLGADVVRGMGWCRLTELRAVRLSREAADLWPWSGAADVHDHARSLAGRAGVASIDPAAIGADAGAGPWWYAAIDGEIRVGMREDGWGVDAISIGGHAAGMPDLAWPAFQAHVVAPVGLKAERRGAWFDPGDGIAMTRGSEGRLAPFIPGSAIRGPLRHEVSRQARRVGLGVADPNADAGRQALRDQAHDGRPDAAQAVFGSLEWDSTLLVRDARLEGEWTAALFQHHAGDEFAGGVFGSGKFERLAITKGAFGLRLVMEGRTQAEVGASLAALEPALHRAARGGISMGAGAWRGLGWPAWRLGSTRTFPAGSTEVLSP